MDKRATVLDSGEEHCGNVLATRPKDYTTTVDRVTQKLFKNELVRPLDAEANALWDVPLDGKKRRAMARVAIDYKALIESKAFSKMPMLTQKHYILHDAIITLIIGKTKRIKYFFLNSFSLVFGDER